MSTKIPKETVFSTVSQTTRCGLKLVEIDRLKDQQEILSHGVVPEDAQPGPSSAQPASPALSCSEDYLKTEPKFETMYRDTDCEFFQDLGLWCSVPAKEELVQTIDSTTPGKNREETALHSDITYTQLSPQGLDGLDANSPNAHSSFFNTTPNLSPTVDSFMSFEKPIYRNLGTENKLFQEQFLDISSLPVVIGDMGSAPSTPTFVATPGAFWANTHDTDYTKHYTETHKMPFIDQDDSLDMKFVTAVVPQDVERSDEAPSPPGQRRLAAPALTLDVSRPFWPDAVISTPEVLSYVEQLEKQDTPMHNTRVKPNPIQWSPQETGFDLIDTFLQRQEELSPPSSSTPHTSIWVAPEDSGYPLAEAPKASVDYEQSLAPVTPKTDSGGESDEDSKPLATRKRRRPSQDSDDSYSPYADKPTTRKYRKRKQNVPIKDMILALEEAQPLTKVRRGRPPKRRDSTVSSICSNDNASNLSTQEVKYREMRDKNNEASKRSRMSRKLKELQMEQQVYELQERNKKLQVKADILEEMTKRLKDALMTAILQK